jgi:hypothetical protein
MFWLFMREMSAAWRPIIRPRRPPIRIDPVVSIHMPSLVPSFHSPPPPVETSPPDVVVVVVPVVLDAVVLEVVVPVPVFVPEPERPLTHAVIATDANTNLISPLFPM